MDVCRFEVMPAAHEGRAWAFHPSFLHRHPPSLGVLPLLPPWLSLLLLSLCLSQKRCFVLVIRLLLPEPSLPSYRA